VSPRRSALTTIGMAIVSALAVVAVAGPLLSPHDPRAITGESLERPSGDHLFGTNDIGQDIFSQIVAGARPSLTIAVVAAGMAMGLGILAGVGAGLRGGAVDMVVSRLIDVILALPSLPLIIVVAALARPSRVVVVMVIGFVAWPQVARILRSQTMSLRERGFVHAASGFGGGDLYVLRRHVVPALTPHIVTNFVNVAGVAVILDAALSFFGLGDPTTVTWGQVLFRAVSYPGLYFSGLWTWWVLPAGLAITLAVLGFTFLGVGLEPRANPRAARTL
jgi:peptide/nickel transport system permease protein